jgi:Spy/CpxP family protein refolding chaperone
MTTSTTSLTERTPRQVRLLTALLLFATFLLGAATGAGFAHWLALPPPHLPPVPFLPGPSDTLHLTPDQEAHARAIMDNYRPKLEAVWREGFPKLQAIDREMENEMRQLLTPQQKRTLDEIEARRPPLPPGPAPGPGFGPPGGFPPGPLPPEPMMPPPGSLPGVPPGSVAR